MSLEFLVACIFILLVIAILPIVILVIGFIFLLILVIYFFAGGYYVLTHQIEAIALILLGLNVVAISSIIIGYLTRDIPILNRLGKSGLHLDVKISNLTTLKKLITYLKIQSKKHLLRGLIVFLLLSIAIIKIQKNLAVQ